MAETNTEVKGERLPSLSLSWSSLGSSSSASSLNSIAHAQFNRSRQTLSAQASTDKVCLLLNGSQLVHTLPFWSNYFEDKQDGEGNVSCVCIAEGEDSTALYVAATAGHCVVVWTTSKLASGKEKWQVHSRLQVGEGEISSIDMSRDMLLVGSERSLTLWMLSKGSRQDWTRKWRLRTPKRVIKTLFCPTGQAFAVLLENDRRICTWRLVRGSKPQGSGSLTHSRVVVEMSWRREPEEVGQTTMIASRTSDGAVRLWTAVIDEPNVLRVWSTIDPASMASEPALGAPFPPCHYLDALDMSQILLSSLQWLQRDLQMAEVGVGEYRADQEERMLDLKRSRARRLEHLLTETPDMFALVQSDGTLVIQAVANVDRKPPTLCQSFIVLKMATKLSVLPSLVSRISVHPLSTSPSSDCYQPTGMMDITLRNGDLVKLYITPSLLFDGLGQGLTKLDACHAFHTTDLLPTSHNHPIRTLVTMPANAGVCSISQAGGVIEWTKEARVAGQEKRQSTLQARRVVLSGLPKIIAAHRDLLAWQCSRGECWLSSRSHGVSSRHRLRGIPASIDVDMLMVRLSSNFVVVLAASCQKAEVYVWKVDRASLSADDPVDVDAAPLGLQGEARLLRAFEVAGQGEDERIRLGTLDQSGLTTLWFLAGCDQDTPRMVEESRLLVAEPAKVDSVVCNTIGVIAMASSLDDGTSMVRIFDSRSSFCSVAAEVEFKTPDGQVSSLAWSPASNTGPSMLAISTSSSVWILCRRHLTYLDRLRLRTEAPRWTSIARLSLGPLCVDAISSVVWQADMSILVAVSNMLLEYSGQLQSLHSTLPSHLISLAAELTCPLADWEPEVIIRCLQWGKVATAKQIILNLGLALAAWMSSEPELHFEPVQWVGKTDWKMESEDADMPRRKELFGEEKEEEETGKLSFSARCAPFLAQLDSSQPLSCFTHSQQRFLASAVETVGQVHRQEGLLDADGLRYFAAMTYLDSCASRDLGPASLLDHQSFLWAYHSLHQDRLVQALEWSHKGKMNWQMARRYGIFLWLRSDDDLRVQAELVARQQFASQDERDPTACSLLYYALGKQKLVSKLWKQAFWHPDQKKMLAFLNNDFTLQRWKSAALKNAFALLSQRRFEMAASFFLLGGGLRDAVNVCVRNLGDLSLAIAIARLSEGGTKGPVFTNLLRKDVLQEALYSDNRWLATWSLDMLDQRDLALQAVCRPLPDVIAAAFPESLLTNDGGPSAARATHDDATLVLHFARQVERGLPASLSTQVEARLVLHAHRILCNDGLDSLGLCLLSSHQFQTSTQVITEPALASGVLQGEVVTDAEEEHKSTKKIASLVQSAKPEISKQADLTFDVNSFNF